MFGLSTKRQQVARIENLEQQLTRCKSQAEAVRVQQASRIQELEGSLQTAVDSHSAKLKLLQEVLNAKIPSKDLKTRIKTELLEGPIYVD